MESQFCNRMLIICQALMLCAGLGCNSGGGNTPLPPPDPVISGFQANPPAIVLGGSASLTGIFANGTGLVTPGGLSAASGVPLQVAPSGNTTYTLTVTNSLARSTTASASVQVATQMVKYLGDSQTAPPGTAVPVAPQVTVLDGSYRGVAGITVHFAVASGGGTIQNVTAQTDGSGNASAGTWNLGTATGPVVLTASVPGLEPVSFSALAAVVSPDVRPTVELPATGQMVGDVMTIVTTVWSTYQISSVTASLGGNVAALANVPYEIRGYHYAWTASLPLPGMQRGPATLLVTVKDVFGNTTTTATQVILDKPPLVDLASPLDLTVALPLLNLAVTGTDPNVPQGPVTLTARIKGTLVATGIGSINQSIDLTPFVPPTWLTVEARDSLGQKTSLLLTVYGDSNAHLTLATQVPGRVMDASGPRTLFIDPAGGRLSMALGNSQTGEVQTLMAGVALINPDAGIPGFIHPAGAIFVQGDTLYYPDGPWLHDVRDGVNTKVLLYPPSSLAVAGNWAIYRSPGLWLRDLLSGVSIPIDGADYSSNADVAANGDIVYEREGAILLWRNGSGRVLTDSGADPVTDGRNVVYQKVTGSGWRVAMNDGSAETLLSDVIPTGSGWPNYRLNYAAAGGNVAYVSPDPTHVLQVWRLGPGAAQQLTFFSSPSYIEALGPDGTVILTNNLSRYRAVPGAALERIGHAQGQVFYRDGGFIVCLGRAVLRIAP